MSSPATGSVPEGNANASGAKKVPKPIMDRVTEYRPWQAMLMDEIKQKPDRRTVNWFWDSTGNTGKTALCKHICMTRHAVYFHGRGSDAEAAIANRIKKHESTDIVLWDIPRTAKDYVKYEIIDFIKDGIFPYGRYGQLLFNSPHLYVFANFLPDRTKVSQDRWRIFEIPTG